VSAKRCWGHPHMPRRTRSVGIAWPREGVGCGRHHHPRGVEPGAPPRPIPKELAPFGREQHFQANTNRKK
jgi:hypothetical protein